MRSLDSVTFDTTGFTAPRDDRNTRVWQTEDGDPLTLYFLGKPSPRSAGPERIDEWRASARASVRDVRGAIVEVELATVDGCMAIREIVKVPQQPTGMAYLGSLMLPFRDFGYMLSVAARERGTTGTRDTLVLMKLMQTGEVHFAEGADQPTGWMTDPYDPAIETPPGRNRSDDAEYDEIFPKHPLSRVRRALARIEATMRLATEVKNEAADW